MERVEDLLKIASHAYITRYHSLSSVDKLRFLAVMEGYMIVLGKIPAGQVGIPYEKIEKKILGFIPYKTKETYEEYILRLTGEFLFRE